MSYRTFSLLCGCEEIDRSPLANSMHIRVTGRYTVDWSGQGVGSYTFSVALDAQGNVRLRVAMPSVQNGQSSGTL